MKLKPLMESFKHPQCLQKLPSKGKQFDCQNELKETHFCC